MPPALVGRKLESERIARAVERAGGHRLVAVVLTGEPGIGKSRLLDAVLEGIGERGWRVVAGSADQLERQIPYAMLVRPLRGLSGDRDEEVAALARDLITTLETLGSASRRDIDASFGEVCGQTTRLLEALLELQPVVLAVDDLHALDDDTPALLAVVLRRLVSERLVFVASSRTELPVPAVDRLLGRLEREGVLEIVALERLSTEEVGELVAPVLGARPEASLVGQIDLLAEGNPFFAVEVAVSLVAAGLVAVTEVGACLAGDLSTLRLSRGSAVVQRFAPLDRNAFAVLEAIAVLGAVELEDLDGIAAVTALGTNDVATAFDELVDARLVRAGEVRFELTHDLVRDAVYDEIGPARRRWMHRAVAERMLSERARGVPIDVLTLAGHVAQSADVGDPEAMSILCDAGDRMTDVAPGSAAAFYAAAARLALPGQGDEAAHLLGRCSRALSLAARPAEAAERGRLALRDLKAGSDRTRVANIVIASLLEIGQEVEALAVADAEVAAGAAGPLTRAQRALALWHLERFREARDEERQADLHSASSAAERVLVLGVMCVLSTVSGRPAGALEAATELLALADSVPRKLEVYALAYAGDALASAGFIDRAIGPLARAEELLDDDGGTTFRAIVAHARALVDWRNGRWDEAVDGIEAGHLESEASQPVLNEGLRAIEIDISTYRGDPVRPEWLAWVPATRVAAYWKAWSVAGLLQATGDLDRARTELVEALEQSRESISNRWLVLARLLEIDVAQGRPAEAILSELDACACEAGDPLSSATALRSRAVVFQDAAAAEEAVAVAAGAGLVFEQARAQLARAELDVAAVEGLTAAYLTFQNLGADSLRRSAGMLLRERGLKVPRRAKARTGLLTEAELKMARLVQQGLRNREIATALHYSPGTVNIYLSRIYAKLAVSSRLELARAMDSRGFNMPTD